MLSLKCDVVSLLLTFFATTALADDVNVGYNAYKAAQVMVEKAGQSWEWGTAAEALLELYNPELSVFGSNPFPNGNIPPADPGTLALTYARQFINTDSQVLVANSAVGDPASLGVSAILLGQSDSTYIGAAQREANYILNDAPRWSNGAISHRPDVAELWADNMAMSFPFLAYLAVQENNVTLMSVAATQCGLYRDVLKAGDLNWQHIIGPQSQDTGLWSTGNGWASYGMVRVLHTMQKWPGSSSLASQASDLKSWIKEILDGAMESGQDNGLLRNYLNDNSWFGEISGTALITAVAYRMAVNDPGMFPQSYIDWADSNRQSLAQKQGSDGIFAPAVDPYAWQDRTEYTSGSPEGQAFTVFLYTAYRDCVAAGVCQPATPSVTTISSPGIGPIDILTVLSAPVTFSSMPAPTGVACGAPESCDTDGCQGTFNGLAKNPTCQAGSRQGCECTPTSTTCGAQQSCDLNGCAGAYNGLTKDAQCTGNFAGCSCIPTSTTCGAKQSCDLNGCAGAFNGLERYPQCTGNFVGCNCTATANTCGARESCDLNGCAGAFTGLSKYPQCQGNFQGCDCTATANTCGERQSCDLNGCAGAFNGVEQYAQCTGNFEGCDCAATTNTCGAPQSCGLNNCGGAFDLTNGLAWCTENFQGCECVANPGTCGDPQSCDQDNCQGAFNGSVPVPQCTNFFKGCTCQATSNTCGPKQSCDANGCAGGFDASGVARCQGNFIGCECTPTTNTCGVAQNCDLNGCNGSFDSDSNTARCRGNFAGCVCNPVAATCGSVESCSLNGCNGAFNGGNPICTGNFYGCPCRPDPIWIPPPPTLPRPSPSPTPSSSLPPIEHPWYCVGLYEEDDCEDGGGCTRSYGLGVMDMTAGKVESSDETGIRAHSATDLCGANINGAGVICEGDITAQCANYGVALYASRSCRTYCPSIGDHEFCWDIFDGYTDITLTAVLICDRALP